MTSSESPSFSGWPLGGADKDMVIQTKPSEILVLALLTQEAQMKGLLKFD